MKIKHRNNSFKKKKVLEMYENNKLSGNVKNDTQYNHKIEIHENFKPVLPFGCQLGCNEQFVAITPGKCCERD
jgi:hypothetical protein